MKLVAACVILILQGAGLHLALQAPQAAPASIEGIVESDNGQPLPGAQVALTGAGRTAIPPVFTDRTGRFHLSNLSAGTYKLAASSNGYMKTEFGQHREDAPGAPIVLKDGETVQDITIRLKPAGYVSGYLRRANGRPAPGVAVQLVRRNWDQTGRLSFSSAGSVRSDDRGAYRFYWVTPGRYYVVAGSLNSIADQIRSSNDNEIVERYSYTFFSGSIDFEKAIAIDVKPGAELDGIDIALTSSSLFRIHARVIDPSTGKPPVRAIGSISNWSPNGSTSLSGGDLYKAQTGILEYSGLTPGVYDVSISAYDGPGIPTAASNRGAPGASAGTRVTVTDRDVDLGVLTLESPATISGQLRVEGAPLTDSARGNLQIRLLSATSDVQSATQPPARSISARLQPDGNLTANFPYSSARISVSGLPASHYIREAKLDDVDVLRSFAPITPSSTLTIVVSSNGGEIDGVVRDAQSRRLAGVPAVLVPQTERSRRELFKQAITDQNGRFSLTGIAPGEYKLFAWERLAPYSYFDPDVLREYETNGTPIVITETSREALELRVIPTN